MIPGKIDDRTSTFPAFRRLFGLSCSCRSIAASEKPAPGFLDTYANLLYKTGRTADAIAKETEALNLAESSQKQAFQETLDKMKAGTRTWN
jgi:hypothetical protein